MRVVYDTSFDSNEWFVIITLLSLHLIVLITPKLFSFLEGTAYYLYGVFIVSFFDHTISVSPWDVYDVNDSSNYQFMDFLTYVMNGPYSYFFIYLYIRLQIKGFKNIPYIVMWSLFSVLFEWISVSVGLYHYDKGYKMYWSFPIYMTVQSILIILYHCIRRKS